VQHKIWLCNTKFECATQNLIVRHKFWLCNTKFECATQNLIVRHKFWLCDTKLGCATQNCNCLLGESFRKYQMIKPHFFVLKQHRLVIIFSYVFWVGYWAFVTRHLVTLFFRDKWRLWRHSYGYGIVSLWARGVVRCLWNDLMNAFVPTILDDKYR
jgi:hypothetical protein